MYLINPAIERDDADGGALVVIYRLTTVDVAAETSYQRRRYMTENATNLAVLHTSEVDGLDEHLESYPDPTRCSCLLRWRPAAGSTIGQDKVTSVGEFELLQPFTPLPEPDDWLTTSRIMYGFEDPRLFRFRGKLWVICGFLGSGLSCLPWTTPSGTALKDELRRGTDTTLCSFPSTLSPQRSTSGLLCCFIMKVGARSRKTGCLLSTEASSSSSTVYLHM